MLERNKNYNTGIKGDSWISDSNEKALKTKKQMTQNALQNQFPMHLKIKRLIVFQACQKILLSLISRPEKTKSNCVK